VTTKAIAPPRKLPSFQQDRLRAVEQPLEPGVQDLSQRAGISGAAGQQESLIDERAPPGRRRRVTE
jgi:hypothetical protein